jgi:hypothetical protein
MGKGTGIPTNHEKIIKWALVTFMDTLKNDPDPPPINVPLHD